MSTLIQMILAEIPDLIKMVMEISFLSFTILYHYKKIKDMYQEIKGNNENKEKK